MDLYKEKQSLEPGLMLCAFSSHPEGTPTFPTFFSFSIKEPESRLEFLRDCCNRLPKDNYNNLRYLIRFLAKLAEYQEVNKMTPSNIAIVLGPNLLWPQQNEGSNLQLDMASVSSIQVVGVVEPLIQNAETLFPGDIDFNISDLFTPPLETKDSEVFSVEEPASCLVPAEPTFSLPDERKSPEVIAGTALPKGTQTSAEAAVSLPTPVPAGDTSRKSKRAAPPRPTVPPPLTQPRTPAPVQHQGQPPASEPPAIPKALPRKAAGNPIRAPSTPPPLPPQPARRQSRNAPPSPKPRSEPVSNEAAATAAEVPPAEDCSIETSKDSTPLAMGHDEPTSVGENGSPSKSDLKVQTLEND